MNKIYTTLVCFLLVNATTYAQAPVLLFEDFNETFDTLDNVSLFAFGNDTTWVNFDVDGIADGNARPQNWYQDTWFAEDSAQDGVMLSSSWLAGFADGNRNWLILPPIYLEPGNNADALLSWKSAPYQGPRYMDGYSVRISTTSNDPLLMPSPFTDVVFEAVQMIPPLGTGYDVSTFSYSPQPTLFGGTGYIHASDFTDTTYALLEDSTSTTYNGLLEPHSVDLSAYAGMVIYIAFVHDSDDDNLLALDDIKVEGNGQYPVTVSTLNQPLDAEIKMYPNPVVETLNLNYTIHAKGDVNATIVDMQGRVVRDVNTISTSAGTFNHAFEVGNLPAGTYQLVLSQNGKRISKAFIKQ